MAFISKITGSGALWIVIALLLMLQKKYRVLGVAIIIALGFVFIIGDQGLKPHVARLRPFVDFPNVTVPLESALPKASSYSFPSGHSFGSFASAMTIYLGLSQIAPQKRYLGILALILSVVVAFSRVYFICTLSNRCINRLSIRDHRRVHRLEVSKSWLELVD